MYFVNSHHLIHLKRWEKTTLFKIKFFQRLNEFSS